MSSVLKNAAFFRTLPKNADFLEKCKKVQKSDFARKRSHFRKKDCSFVMIKKNFFLANFFGDLKNGHTFLCPFLENVK